MSMRQRGFSLTEVLIATAVSSLLLISASRFLPGLQRAVLLQSGQREREEEVWQHLFALANSFSVRDTARETVRDKGC